MKRILCVTALAIAGLVVFWMRPSTSRNVPPTPAGPVELAVVPALPVTEQLERSPVSNPVAVAPDAEVPALVAALVNATEVPSADGEEPDVNPPAVAVFQLGGEWCELESGESGRFERVGIEPAQVVPVRVNFSAGAPGDVVTVGVQDGGKLEDGSVSRLLQLGNDLGVVFDFHAGTEPGIYRVSLRCNGNFKQLRFWVRGSSLASAPTAR